MSLSGPEVERRITSLGISKSRFARMADVAVPTLLAFFGGRSVRETTVAKIRSALARAEAQSELAAAV